MRAEDLKPGITAKIRGKGRKNRVTVFVTLVTSAPMLADVRVWGDRVNAPFGQSSKFCALVRRDEECEVPA